MQCNENTRPGIAGSADQWFACVASRVGGIPDSIIENETGLLVESKNTNDFCEALFKLYQSPALRSAFGERGKSFVREKFDAEMITTKMIAFYKQ